MKDKFKGVWPAVFTPVLTNGDPSYREISKLVELLISQEMDGLYILGSTGQGLLFSEEQRKKITEVVAGVASRQIPIMVQVGSLTTAESVRLAKHAKKCGVDGISAVGPVYYTGNADTALAHYRSIAEATSLPFFPYQLGDASLPGNIHSFIDGVLEIPNIMGMKLTTNQLLDISAIHNYAGEKLKLFSGSDELFCHASLCGTVGAIGSFYNIWGPSCRQVLEAFKDGNFQLGRDFMLSFQRIIRLVLPNIWTFFRKAMQLKYHIDIGPSIAPLGNSHEEWKDKEVRAILAQMEQMAVILQKAKTDREKLAASGKCF